MSVQLQDQQLLQRPALRLLSSDMLYLPISLRHSLGNKKLIELEEALADIRYVFPYANLTRDSLDEEAFAVDFTRVKRGDLSKGATKIGNQENIGQFQLFKLMVAMSGTSMEIITPLNYNIEKCKIALEALHNLDMALYGDRGSTWRKPIDNLNGLSNDIGNNTIKMASVFVEVSRREGYNPIEILTQCPTFKMMFPVSKNIATLAQYDMNTARRYFDIYYKSSRLKLHIIQIYRRPCRQVLSRRGYEVSFSGKSATRYDEPIRS